MKLNYESIVIGNFQNLYSKVFEAVLAIAVDVLKNTNNNGNNNNNSNNTQQEEDVKKIVELLQQQQQQQKSSSLSKCILVPYRNEHVQQYHTWMSIDNPNNNLVATASEPLSLEEEYSMQQTWYHDNTKCTFIILSKDIIYNNTIIHHENEAVEEEDNNKEKISNPDAYNYTTNQWLVDYIEQCNTATSTTTTTTTNISKNEQHPTTDSTSSHTSFIQQTIPAMVGDVNLFLSDYDDTNNNDDDIDDDENDDIQQKVQQVQQHQVQVQQQAEIDIMIAESHVRNSGYGYEAVLLMMLYSSIYIKPSIQRYYCKIHESNHISQYLFTQKLFFIQCNYTKCFQEYEYEFCSHSNTTTTSMYDTIVHKIIYPNMIKQIIKSSLSSSSSSITTTSTTSEEHHDNDVDQQLQQQNTTITTTTPSDHKQQQLLDEEEILAQLIQQQQQLQSTTKDDEDLIIIVPCPITTNTTTTA